MILDVRQAQWLNLCILRSYKQSNEPCQKTISLGFGGKRRLVIEPVHYGCSLVHNRFVLHLQLLGHLKEAVDDFSSSCALDLSLLSE